MSVLAVLVGLIGAVAPGGALAGGNAGVKVMKTVDSTSITPALSLTLATSQPAAIPGDHLTYSGQVSNTGSSLGMTGHFTGESHANTTSNVASYFDEVEVCSSVCTSSTPVWTALAGFAAIQPGYTPVEAPAVATGLTLTATPVTASNVTYPGSGDPILGTQIGPAAAANWTYQAALALTSSQIAALSDPTKVQSIRNTFHMEVTPRNELAAQPWDAAVRAGFGFGQQGTSAGRFYDFPQPPMAPPIAIGSTEPR